jgi:hypothetical protein
MVSCKLSLSTEPLGGRSGHLSGEVPHTAQEQPQGSSKPKFRMRPPGYARKLNEIKCLRFSVGGVSWGTWPVWWEWELELTPHLERRMEDRAFTELDLRAMLERAAGLRADVVDGRFEG